MLEGVAEVPWGRLGYWSGGPDAVPGILREIATAPSGTEERSPVWRLRHGLFQGIEAREVYEAAPYLVPYLLEVTRSARQPHRGLVMDLMVDMAVAQPHRDVFRDPAAGPEPDHAALARAAMTDRVDAIARLLDDASPKVVAEVARLLACLPDAAPRSLPALRARAEKGVRPVGDAGPVACALAVAWLAAADHAAWFAGLLGAAPAHRDLRAVAAVGLALADPTAVPDDDAVVRLVADVQADPGSVLERVRWHGDGVTPINSALLRAEHWQRAVAGELLTRHGLTEIDQALYSAWEAIWSWRAAPAELLPMVASRVRELAAAPQSVRSRRKVGVSDSLVHAVGLISDSGQAAAPYADLLAELLTGDPAEPWPNVVVPAVEGLGRLGDERCVPWLAAAFLDEYGHVKQLDVREILPAMVAHADALMPALLTYYHPSRRGGMNELDCLYALTSWGAAAAPLAPAIAARVSQAYLSVALPLFGAIGPAAAAVEPRVRALLDDESDRPEAAWALWRMTGVPGQAPALLAENLARYGGHQATDIAPMLEQLGPAATVAVPVLRKLFHDAEHGHLYDRVAIARALWAITGDSEGLVAPLLEAITVRPLSDRRFRGRPDSGLLAVEALGTTGAAAAAAVPALRTIAYGRARVTNRDVRADERFQHAARRALASIEEHVPA
ncbi:hypothetical protein [Nonomuraea sp. NPDC049709]|uniref:hypothetical protein n=1 Tax=Nonomuraea sp. NPDC049709 TaxID=3154736 RepID=UPI00341BEC9A